MNFCTFLEVKLSLKTIYNFLKHLDVILRFHPTIVLIPPNWGAIFLNSKNNGWGVLASMLLDIMK